MIRNFHPLPQYATFQQLGEPTDGWAWEIALPPGDYPVALVLGDATSTAHILSVTVQGHAPTERQLEAIIETWSSAHADETYWDNVGFTFRGESGKIRWLDHSIQKGRIECPFHDVTAERAGVLIDCLVKSRDSIQLAVGL